MGKVKALSTYDEWEKFFARLKFENYDFTEIADAIMGVDVESRNVTEVWWGHYYRTMLAIQNKEHLKFYSKEPFLYLVVCNSRSIRPYLSWGASIRYVWFDFEEVAYSRKPIYNTVHHFTNEPKELTDITDDASYMNFIEAFNNIFTEKAGYDLDTLVPKHNLDTN